MPRRTFQRQLKDAKLATAVGGVLRPSIAFDSEVIRQHFHRGLLQATEAIKFITDASFGGLDLP